MSGFRREFWTSFIKSPSEPRVYRSTEEFKRDLGQWVKSIMRSGLIRRDTVHRNRPIWTSLDAMPMSRKKATGYKVTA